MKVLAVVLMVLITTFLEAKLQPLIPSGNNLYRFPTEIEIKNEQLYIKLKKEAKYFGFTSENSKEMRTIQLEREYFKTRTQELQTSQSNHKCWTLESGVVGFAFGTLAGVFIAR